MTPSPSFRSILVALDESERAPLVFATAMTLARSLGAELTLFRVLTVPPDIPPAAHIAPDGLEQKLVADATAELRRLMATAPDVARRPPLVVFGDPQRKILEVAKEIDVDLIVIGSHGYRGLDRLLGTVAASVVNHAHRDVLVVHEHEA